MKRFFGLLVLMSALLFAVGAGAATLTLPMSTIVIEEEAFYGDTSLDQVVISNKTQEIRSKAFANSGLNKVTIPDSVCFIADDAFDGVSGLTVKAAEGSYGYSWALEKGYIIEQDGKQDTTTNVVVPEKLQAGMNLEVQVFGPANTVSHTVFLINDKTQERKYRYIGEQNETITWEGYEIEEGIYTLKVFTILDNYSVSAPISKTITVSGARPAGPNEIELPEEIGWNGFSISVTPYDELRAYVILFDAAGNQIVDGTYRASESLWLWWDGYEEVKTMSVSLMSYKDGLWSEWSNVKEIKCVNEGTNSNRPKLKELNIPENLSAGEDFEISFACEEGVTRYEIWLDDDNGKRICDIFDYYDNTLTSMIVPGYKTDSGRYKLYVNVYDGEEWYTVIDQDIYIRNERQVADITLYAEKSRVYVNEDIELSIASSGIEGAYIRIEGDDTEYKGCNLQDDGTGTCTTRLNVLDSSTSSRVVTLSACVFLGDRWSEWSKPITVTVTRPEPLPTPQINVKDNYETGEDIIISLSDIEDADEYSVYLKEYFSKETVLSKYYYNDQNPYREEKFGEDIVFSGTLFGSGTYYIEVRAYSSIRQSSTAKKTIKVSGVRQSAPEVKCEPDEFRMKQTVQFMIDTTDCEQAYVRYSALGNNGHYWGDTYTITTTGDTTVWEYTFADDSEGVPFTFDFYVKRNGKWTSAKEIRKTVLGLPPLEEAVIYVDDNIEAGTDFIFSIDPVENATSYRYYLYLPDGNVYDTGRIIDNQRFYGYELEPGEYRIEVYSYSNDYATSVSKKTFTIVGTKEASPEVTLSKSEVFTYETVIFSIDTSGATLLYKTDKWGNDWFIDVTNDKTTYSDSWGSVGDWYCQFALLKNGKWTSLTDPVYVEIKQRPELPTPIIHADESIAAGHDYSFSFEAVENATFYRASFGYPYDNTETYSFDEEVALPKANLTVPGYLINAGNYVVTVTAYADGYASSRKTIYITATGNKPASPAIAVETPLRIKSNAVFTVDTKAAEDMQVKYLYTSDNNWWSEKTVNVPVTGDSTEWKHWIDEYKEGVTLSVSIAVKKNGVWTSWNTNNYVIEGLHPLDEAVIHVDDNIEAGTNFIVSVDTVKNATSYEYYLYNGEKYSSNYYDTTISDHKYYGYDLEPGEYKIKIYAYSDDYDTSISEKTFVITGAKPAAPTVTVDKTVFYTDESRPVFTVTAPGAEAVRCSNGSVELVNEDGTASISPYMYLYSDTQETRSYRFCYIKDDIWSAWSEPISITIIKAAEPEPLDEAVIHLPESISAGQDFSFSFDAVKDATSYEVYISHYYVSSDYYSNYDAEPEKEMAVSGRKLAAGTYIATVWAYGAARRSSSSSIIFKVTGERPAAPSVTSEKNEYSSGEKINFSIDTDSVEEMYVYYSYNGDYSTSGSKTIEIQEDVTNWAYTIPSYYNEGTYTFSFYVKKNGQWSKPKTISIVVSIA